MRASSPTLALASAVLATAALAACALPFGDRDVTEHTHLLREEIAIERRAALTILVENLLGSVTVEPATGKAVEVVAAFTGGGASAEEAEAAAGELKLLEERRDDTLELRVAYPVERWTRYIDPRLAGSAASGVVEDPEAPPTLYQGVPVTVQDSVDDDAVLLHADLVVRVPPGMGVRVALVGGEVHVMQVSGAVTLDLFEGEVRVRESEGELEVNLGSGSVLVDGGGGRARVQGRTLLVEMARFAGEVAVRAEEGLVTLREATMDDVDVRTGTAAIALREVTGPIQVRTRDGGIEGSYLVARDRFVAESDEGSLHIEGDFADARGILLTSDRGEIELGMSHPPPVAFLASTTSGTLDVDLPELAVTREEPRRIEGHCGEAEGRLHVHSDEGGVRIYRLERLFPLDRDWM